MIVDKNQKYSQHFQIDRIQTFLNEQIMILYIKRRTVHFQKTVKTVFLELQFVKIYGL